ncbi:MAG: response regulator transcription factor [Chloroflexi bacterium]|nr:response regulator transcription factor [Chloroflexota bacterium]MBV9595765.1 response regulator transcription factor [Chloroflexota bacterium]
MAQILVVEDEESLLQSLRYNLTRAGHEVRLSTNGAQALEMIRGNPPELVVLDLMLPGLDGLDLCRAVRAESLNPAVAHVPILMLTARDEEIDRVVGLEVGADDYLTKPFSMHELMARVKAQLRRADMGSAVRDPTLQLASGDLLVDVGAHRVSRNAVQLQLKRREFDLLVYLMRHPGQLQTRETLLRNVWGYEYVGDTRTVDVHVRWLRGKIEVDPGAPTRIQTVRGVGYVFTE